jgi:hypothetical protein
MNPELIERVPLRLEANGSQADPMAMAQPCARGTGGPVGHTQVLDSPAQRIICVEDAREEVHNKLGRVLRVLRAALALNLRVCLMVAGTREL